MGNQSASRLEGDRYQHLYAWYELLRLLDADSPFERAVVEHPHAGAADDVTLHARPGSGAASRFMQVKWHVDQQDQYTFGGLTDVGDGARSLLHKLYDSWRLLRETGPVEVWLLSNWPAAPAPDLGGVLRSREWRLAEEFLMASRRQRLGQRRVAWARALKVNEEEAIAFCRDLRLRLGYGSITDLEEVVDDRMRGHGLRYGRNPRSSARDEIAERIERGGGRKEFTREELLRLIEVRDLWAKAPDDPAVRLWVHGWVRHAFEQTPTVELDWTRFFDIDVRRVASPEEWRENLLPNLRRAREQIEATPQGKYIDLRGKVPLTAALAIGNAFRAVAGFKFRVEQPTNTETFLWRSDAPPSGDGLGDPHTEGEAGDDIVVGLGITGPMLPAVRRLRADLAAAALVYVEPVGGPGQTAVVDAGHASALAASARDLLQWAREQYSAKRLHLVVYSPAAFAVFLGQRLNALGVVVTYERNVDGQYQESVSLRTG